jgi:hypothetical protein
MNEIGRRVQWLAARATSQHAANIGLKKKGCHVAKQDATDSLVRAEEVKPAAPI